MSNMLKITNIDPEEWPLKKEHCEFLTPTNMAENGAQANRSGM
jgi:hypothetical protein